MKKILESEHAFILTTALIAVLFILAFTPITYEAQGDSMVYIDHARQIFNLPGATQKDLSHRSPLYSILLGIFIMVFGEQHFLFPVMCLQYVLLFLVSFLLYRLVGCLSGNKKIAFLAGTLSMLNLSSVFNGFMIQTEMLAIFIFTSMAYLTVLYFRQGKKGHLAALGILSALLVLARFNLLGIPFIVIAAVVLKNLTVYRLTNLKRLFFELAIVLIPMLLLLGGWAFYNKVENGYFGLFPPQYGMQRWAVPGTIAPGNSVSSEYEAVLAIFLNAREKILLDSEPAQTPGKEPRKATLLKNKTVRNISDYFRSGVNGYKLYKLAEPELLAHYRLDYSARHIAELGARLRPFYQQIARQNKKDLLNKRIFSFIYTFKYVSPTLDIAKPLNLNRLPSSIIIIYKMVFIAFSVLVFLFSLIHGLWIIIRGKIREYAVFIVFYALLWYFPVSHFYVNIMADANRFKYPAESLMIGIMLLQLHLLYKSVREKRDRPV